MALERYLQELQRRIDDTVNAGAAAIVALNRADRPAERDELYRALCALESMEAVDRAVMKARGQR